MLDVPRVLDWLKAQFDSAQEPIRMAVFAALVIAGLAHTFAPDWAVKIDALGLILTTAWARSHTFPGA